MGTVLKEDLLDRLMKMSPEQLDAIGAALGISPGELVGGLKGSCPACPFNDAFTEMAAQAQNWGCLPDPGYLIELKRRTDQNWACHDDETRVCAGLCHAAKDHGLKLDTGGLVRYPTWFHFGEEAAIAEANGLAHYEAPHQS
jgi:hypothetical protein